MLVKRHTDICNRHTHTQINADGQKGRQTQTNAIHKRSILYGVCVCVCVCTIHASRRMDYSVQTTKLYNDKNRYKTNECESKAKQNDKSWGRERTIAIQLICNQAVGREIKLITTS